MRNKLKTIHDINLEGAPIVIIYHRKDADGKCSGAIAYNYFMRFMHADDSTYPEPRLIGWHYGDPFPMNELTGAVVFMLDLSLQPWGEMSRLSSVARQVIWIDHHASAIAEYEADTDMRHHKFIPVIDSSVAACFLTWQFFFPRTPAPAAVEAISRFDSWTWQDHPYALDFHAGLEIRDQRVEGDLWPLLFNLQDARSHELLMDICHAGRAIQAYRNLQNAKLMDGVVFPVLWREHTFLGLNAVANSLAFDASPYARQVHAGLTFVWRHGQWHIGLYRPSTSEMPDVHLGELAKQMGGGGHRGAAGFQTRSLMWYQAGVELFEGRIGKAFVPQFGPI